MFKNHLSHLYEKSSEGTLLSSCQQCQCIEFMLNEGDVRALGPQLVQQEACEPGNTILQQVAPSHLPHFPHSPHSPHLPH